MDPLIIFAVLAVGLLFLMSRRTRKQQSKQNEFRSSLVPGDDVMTASGLFGTVVEVDDDSDIITLETEPGGSQTRWLRAAIAKRLEGEEYEIDEEDETSDESDPYVATSDSAADELEVPDDLSGLSTTSNKDAVVQHDDGTAQQDDTAVPHDDAAPKRDEDDQTK